VLIHKSYLFSEKRFSKFFISQERVRMPTNRSTFIPQGRTFLKQEEVHTSKKKGGSVELRRENVVENLKNMGVPANLAGNPEKKTMKQMIYDNSRQISPVVHSTVPTLGGGLSDLKFRKASKGNAKLKL
jgi:hypothetical protein